MKNKPPTPLILASQSLRRFELLKILGIEDIRVMPAHLDETPRKKERPRDLAVRLAREKALFIKNSLLKESQDASLSFILAGDTVVATGRRIIQAPDNEKDALQCMENLSGKSHKIYTGICLIDPKGLITQRLVITAVRFKVLDDLEKKAYAESHEGFGKAGGYSLQGFAQSFVKNINGSYSSVIGLPVYETRNLLIGAGFPCMPKPFILD